MKGFRSLVEQQAGALVQLRACMAHSWVPGWAFPTLTCPLTCKSCPFEFDHVQQVLKGCPCV